MASQPAPLSPAAARVFFGAADAWYPDSGSPERPGASQLDLMTPLASRLQPAEARRLERELRILEWLPRLALRRSGFCWLSQPQRRALLERLEAAPIGPLHRRVRRLRATVAESYEAARIYASSASA